jgi:hypothetical protein
MKTDDISFDDEAIKVGKGSVLLQKIKIMKNEKKNFG